MEPPCGWTCRNKCSEKIQEEEKHQIFDSYLSLGILLNKDNLFQITYIKGSSLNTDMFLSEERVKVEDTTVHSTSRLARKRRGFAKWFSRILELY